MGLTHSMSGADYRDALLRHLPPGSALARGPGSLLYRLCHALGDGFAALHARVLDLHEWSDPRTVSGAGLVRWETSYGLPDPCHAAPPTAEADRRMLLHGKVIAIGGQSRAYYLEVIAAIAGHASSTITELGPDWFEWHVDDTDLGAIPARVGETRVGESLLEYSDEAMHLHCVLWRIKPAHTTVLIYS